MKSLFTNVPIEDALNCLEKKLREFHFSDVKGKEFAFFKPPLYLMTNIINNRQA